jgi:hypothetical protein
VKYETDQAVMYHGPLKIGTKDITDKRGERSSLKINCLHFWNLNVQYSYLVREGPFLESSPSHLNHIPPTFSKISFNNTIPPLVGVGLSSSRRGEVRATERGSKIFLFI